MESPAARNIHRFRRHVGVPDGGASPEHRVTRLVRICALLTAMTPAPAAAQSFVYAVADPVRVDNLGGHGFAVHIGAGLERSLGGEMSAGGELGLLYLPRAETHGPGFSSYAPAGQGLLVSVNASRHFAARRATGLIPFATGGFSLLVGEGGVGLFNAGGGVDYFANRHAGVRLEVRDHFVGGNTGIGSVFLQFRAGIVFR
jgi:hypothetical protein